jgi:hypothetical protein
MGSHLAASPSLPPEKDSGMIDNSALDEIAIRNDGRRGEQVLRSVYDFIGRFVVFPSEHARVAVALWILHAHLVDRWESTPRLAFLSPEPASGKSRALEILELLVPRPVLAVNVSAAYLFRRVADDAGRPTILFDEIDTVFGPKAKDNEELRAFLNAGHRRGANFGRCVVRGRTVETEDLPAYSAVALAGLGWLPETILSRSVIIRMRRRHAGEQIEPYRRRECATDRARIYGQIEIWARAQPQDISDWPVMPAEIQDRDADVWEALLAVADAIGGSWPDRSRRAAVALVAASREIEPSLGVRLLADILHVFEVDAMSSKMLLQKLQEIEESPWRDIKGKPLDERGLAHRLRQYGIKSKTIRIGDATPKGYSRSDFHEAWQSYLPAKSATSATSATVANFQGVDVADDVAPVADINSATRSNINNGYNNVADVADVAQLVPGKPKCAQCGSDDQTDLRKLSGTYLHKQCWRFWKRDQTTAR